MREHTYHAHIVCSTVVRQKVPQLSGHANRPYHICADIYCVCRAAGVFINFNST